MKRLLLPLLALAAIVGTVGAFSYNFQDSDGSLITIKHHVGTVDSMAVSTSYYATNASNGNRYFMVYGVPDDSNQGFDMCNAAPLLSTYAAATVVVAGSDYPEVVLLDSGGSILYYERDNDDVALNTRLELKVAGGTAYFYINGVLHGTSGALAQNPSYICFGKYALAHTVSTSIGLDDYVYGDSENKYILGLPVTDVYAIVDDISNPAANGLVYSANGTIVDSTYMYGTWGRGNASIPPDTLPNKTIQLVNYLQGTVYANNYTGTDYSGMAQISISTALISPHAPDGLYALTVDGSGAYSNLISLRSLGANISFDKDQYSRQDIATMTYSVEGGYWDTGTYSYKVMLLDGTYYTSKQNSTLSTQSGSVTYTFTDDDDQGVYYAVIIATDGSGNEHWLDYDYAELDAYVTFTGYVMNETGMVLPNANVSIVQGATVSNSLTPSDGNYTATGFFTGGLVQFNVTASGYNQYYAELIPLVAKTVDLNFTLVATTPSYTGLGIGGVARDGNLEGDTITLGYGRPISGATVYLKNTSNAESYTKTTNIAGWYLCDEGTSCFLTNNRPYDVWGEKLGYDNSANYTVVASG